MTLDSHCKIKAGQKKKIAQQQGGLKDEIRNTQLQSSQKKATRKRKELPQSPNCRRKSSVEVVNMNLQKSGK